jgi:hypothetical protein
MRGVVPLKYSKRAVREKEKREGELISHSPEYRRGRRRSLNILDDIKIIFHRNRETVLPTGMKIDVSKLQACNQIVIAIKFATPHCRQRRVKLILINWPFIYRVRSRNSCVAKISPTTK